MRRILNTLVWAVVFFALPAVAFAADGAVDSTGPGLGAGLAVGLAGLEFRANVRDDVEGDLILNSKQVGGGPVVTLSPYVPSTQCIDQLRCNPHSITVALDATLKNELNTQVLGDLLHRYRLAFVGRGRGARDHKERRQS